MEAVAGAAAFFVVCILKPYYKKVKKSYYPHLANSAGKIDTMSFPFIELRSYVI